MQKLVEITIIIHFPKNHQFRSFFFQTQKNQTHFKYVKIFEKFPQRIPLFQNVNLI